MRKVSMLKIRSFLRLIKDKVNNLKKTILLRLSRHMAVTAYALSATILVFYFGNLAGFQVKPSEYKADAASYTQAGKGLEETTTSDTSVSDLKEYALNGPDNNILSNHLTETVDETAVVTKKRLVNPVHLLGQLSISPAATRFHGVAASMAILKTQQNLLLTEEEVNERLELFALNNGSQEDNETDVNISKEKTDSSVKDAKSINKVTNTTEDSSKDVQAIAADIPASLTLKMNKNMVKTISDEELEILLRIVEAEATGEDIYGKILVANVVLNRVNNSEFPDTISDVVFQKVGSAYQFSPTKDGRYYSVKITKSTKEAVSRALQGEDYSEGALYFFARKLTSEKKANWFDSTLKKVVQYGCHEFYANR